MQAENEIFNKAQKIVALIEPLGDLEQCAALEIAETMRAYRQVSRSLISPPRVPVCPRSMELFDMICS